MALIVSLGGAAEVEGMVVVCVAGAAVGDPESVDKPGIWKPFEAILLVLSPAKNRTIQAAKIPALWYNTRQWQT